MRWIDVITPDGIHRMRIDEDIARRPEFFVLPPIVLDDLTRFPLDAEKVAMVEEMTPIEPVRVHRDGDRFYTRDCRLRANTT